MNNQSIDQTTLHHGHFAARAVNMVVISNNDIFSAGIRMMLSENLRVGAIHTFPGTDAFIVAHKDISENVDLVMIDEDAQPGSQMPYGWINSLTGFAQTSVVVVAAANSGVSLAEIISRGVRACVEKNQPAARIIQAVRAALRHDWWVAEEYRNGQRADARRDSDPKLATRDLFRHLSQAEQCVVRKLMNGMTVKEISEHHARSIKTVSGQKMAAMRKLNVKNIVELHRLLGSAVY